MTQSPYISFDAALDAYQASEVAYRRHYRSRNLTNDAHIATAQLLRADRMRIDDSLLLSVYKGLLAAKQNAVPAIFTLTLMGLLAWSFHSIPIITHFFYQVSLVKEKMGIAFPFIISGACVAMLSESIAVFSGPSRYWTMRNTLSFSFLFITFGLMATAKDPIFVLLAKLYGEDNGISTLIKKTLFDQFIWTALVACPYQTLLFGWRNSGFSFTRFKQACPTLFDFFAIKMLPVLISNWAFWIPMATIIYSFPTEIQLPVSIIAISLWVCILNILTKNNQADT